jgi:hypothetical protein
MHPVFFNLISIVSCAVNHSTSHKKICAGLYPLQAESQVRKSRMAAMRAAKHAWSNVHSDLLTNLRLIGAFDHVPPGEAQLQFCQVCVCVCSHSGNPFFLFSLHTHHDPCLDSQVYSQYISQFSLHPLHVWHFSHVDSKTV